MFLALFGMVLVRFAFWAIVVCGAVFLVFAAAIGVIIAGIVSLYDEDRGADWHDAACLLMRNAVRTAMFADNHRRWLLPNTQRSKRY